VLLAQCDAVLDRVRRKSGDNGIGIRLTYLLARQRQLIDRLREILELVAADGRLIRSVRLMKELLAAEQKRHRLLDFIGENVSLLARNITDHASRQGEHYIAEDRTAWWAMAYGAAGGGVIIACMAMLKVQLAVPHLPPLTEGIAFGLNYGLGFVLIHLLGFTVATKQPAMTAAAIAATVEEAHPRELERLGDLAQNVVRTQFIAVLGNVGLALPVACLIALAWPLLFGDAPVTAAKAASMLRDMHPFTSGSLFFAAVAGVGLFLSGLVSGYFDNQARYHRLAGRIAVAPWLAWLGRRHTARIGDYLDAHYGAILGNLFFGMYLGLVGVLGTLTGLPVDIRHVAFSSANLGTALTLLDAESIKQLLPWAVAGVIGIALVNLAVSFSLALYVAMKSRRLGSEQMFRLTALMLRRFAQRPLAFFSPPAKR
jgi:site-specific recombinase